ncbi:hypothetical protein GCM10010178_42910 [Lentzea flava]|uniref:Transglycosylase SLT domain-containing protein n=1 Tax=Lentzea flava TaxID=103732 RepID=A0ABQ2UQJ3_9PSEU|nr:hypothetical protein GCM10010178_42910 [Lentzea flava]
MLLLGSSAPVLVAVPAAELPAVAPLRPVVPPVTSSTTVPVPPAPAPPLPPPRDPMPACGVASYESRERWIDQASAALAWNGERAITDRAAVLLIIEKESSGDPCAINLWDSNFYAGTPSKGLIQAIDPTFERWHLAGYNEIYHPVDSIIAGVRYARGRYGSESRVPGVVGMRAGRGYVGY